MNKLLACSIAFVGFTSVLACGGQSDASSAAPTASADSNRVGAPPPNDAGVGTTDSSPPAPTVPKTWCNQHEAHDFCADFDDDGSPWGWDRIVEGDMTGGHDTYEAEPSSGSTTNVFHQHGAALPEPPIGSKPSGTFAGVILSKKLAPTQKQKARLAMDIFVTELGDILDVFEIRGRKNGRSDIAFGVWGQLLATSTSILSARGSVPQLPPLPRGKWVHVTVLVDDHGGTQPGTVTLSFDDRVVGTVPLEGRLSDATETTLYLGNTRTAGHGPYDFAVDNVTFDWL